MFYFYTLYKNLHVYLSICKNVNINFFNIKFFIVILNFSVYVQILIFTNLFLLMNFLINNKQQLNLLIVVLDYQDQVNLSRYL